MSNESIHFMPANEVEVTGGHLNFSVLKSNPPALPTGPDIELPVTKEKRPYRRKATTAVEGSTEIVEGDVVETRTLDSYRENLGALQSTIAQIDSLSYDIKKDFDALRSSKVIKGKFQYESLLSKNLTELLSAKVMAIKEINSTIKNSIDLDYRKEKDRKEAEASNDDQQIMNLYNAFVSSPVSQGMQARSVLGPSTSDMTLAGTSGIIGSSNVDIEAAGMQNYLNNITPEKNIMRYEKDPNVKQVVVFDQATGEKHFDVINMVTGQSIPNVPRRDDMFLSDTTIDPRKKIARNINLNETYPVVVLNENSTLREY